MAFVSLVLFGASGAGAQPTGEDGAIDGAPSAVDPYFPSLGNSGYDVDHYDVELWIDPGRRFVRGTTSINLVPKVALRSFTFDLVGFEVTGVEVDGVPARFAREDRKLRVTPEQPLAEGSSVEVRVGYEGKPQRPQPYTGWIWFRGGGALLSPQPSGARTLFPCNDHPSDKATFAYDLTTPRGTTAVANGLPSELPAPDADSERVAWSEPGSLPTYAAVVAVGRYRLTEEIGEDGLPAINAFPERYAGRLAERLRRQDEIVSVLEDRLGPYPYSSIGAIVTPVGGVDAMEAASRPTYNGIRWALEGRYFEQVVAHEIAHQWLGNTVSFGSWRDIWLTEGFSTYGELLWISHKRGVPIGKLFKRNSDVFGYYRSMNEVPPGNPGPRRIFNVSVYNRGALTLEALRRTVGDEVFYEILREWVDRYRDNNATTEDFILLSELISGRDLDEFFDRWLYKKRLPSLPGAPQEQNESRDVSEIQLTEIPR